MRRHALAFGIVLVLSAKSSAVRASDALEGFETFAESLRTEWKIPGMAIAIVKGDDVLLRQGFGYRDSAKKMPVTAQTRFAIGSISKSFTATGLGILVDQGKLDWNTPVRDWLPLFRLKDQ